MNMIRPNPINNASRFFVTCMAIAWLFSCGTACRTTAYKNVPHNPVLNKNFPDPTVIRFNGRYYAYATQGDVSGKTWNIQVASSPDMQHWEPEGDALPRKPHWADSTQDFWAPHVLYDGDLKKFVLFYSGESDDTATGKCLGVAFADQPTGPFQDKGTPLLCGEGFQNIDPMALTDPKTGKKLLYWGSGFQPIKVQEMTADWMAFKEGSTATPLVYPGTEKNYTILLEGAWIDYVNDEYYLYYSGDNCCGPDANYAVLVAKAEKPFGPFRRMGESKPSGSSVILERDSTWLAPGHNSIIRDAAGNAFIAYHAIDYNKRKQGKDSGSRVMLISPILYKNGWPEVIQNTKK
jgi:arabinan endo-1,5-alpha-L-arabinosidase